MSSVKSMLTVSVIVAVHNNAAFIEGCLRSLEAQTFDHNRFEAIVVDDGSTDDSPRLVEQFAQSHPWVRVVRQEHKGIYAARNAGIDLATAKYLLHLEAAEELAPDTIAAAVRFFDAHYDEVDVVTYRLTPYVDGNPEMGHHRYDILGADGVYDLNEGDNCFLSQTSLNVLVKNRFEDNLHFGEPADDLMAANEAMGYVTKLLLDKMRLGYVGAGECRHLKDGVESSELALRPYYSFESTVSLFEELFGRYEQVPRYLQGTLACVLSARMWSWAVLPTHLQGADYEAALDRLGSLLDNVDDDLFVTYPRQNPYHSLYLINLKHGAPLEGKSGPRGLVVERNDSILYASGSLEVCVERTRIHDNVLDIFAVAKTPVSFYADCDITLYAKRAHGATTETTEIVPLSSAQSYNGTNQITAHFLAFRYHLPLDEDSQLTFTATVDGHAFRCHFTTYPEYVNFVPQLGFEVLVNDKVVSMQPGGATFVVEPASKERVRGHRKLVLNNLDARILAARASMKAYALNLHRTHKKLWVYSDAPGRLDNAWHQFLHDAPKDDGVMRIYIANNVDASAFEETKSAKVVPYGSREHKMLHFVADKRLCSDIAWSCTSCWDRGSTQNYVDLNHAEMIYLQHGVLWAHLPWYYGFDRVLYDREVVSTAYEIENLTRNYGFLREDLIASGMPRYSTMNPAAEPQKKVLLCPSWRSYLIGELTPSGREPLEERFMASAYYQNIKSFLEDPRLAQMLEKHGYTLDFKLHPNFGCYRHLFTSKSEAIRIVESRVNEEEYAAIITDYSSYCFDFVYLNRAIVFYIPDDDLFKANLGNYTKLDIERDEGFGAFVSTADDALAALEQILENDGKPVLPYAEREEGFFLHYDSQQMNRLYEALKG